MVRCTIERNRSGAELVCREDRKILRLWFPTVVKALIAKAQLEASGLLATGDAARARPAPDKGQQRG